MSYTLGCGASAKSLSHVRLFVTPCTVAHQASLSMGFSRQEYGSELPFPSSGHLPDPGIEPRSPTLAGGFFTTESTVYFLNPRIFFKLDFQTAHYRSLLILNISNISKIFLKLRVSRQSHLSKACIPFR